MLFTGEGSWRWRMMLPSTDRSYDTFWRQSLRWLALPATDPVAIRLPAGAAPGDLVNVHVLARDAAFTSQSNAIVDIHVTSPSGRDETLRGAETHDADDEGAYVGTFRADGPGVYHVRAEAHQGSRVIGTAASAILVGGSDPEMTDPRLNQQVLQRLAVRSGGRLAAAGESAALAEHLRAAVPAARLAVTHELWHTGWSFALVVALLTTEWLLRRHWGLR
jgi:hypothetical protein